MKLTITINLDNDAFCGCENPEYEAKRILGVYLKNWQPGLSLVPLIDINGKTVGSAEVFDY